MSISPEAEYKKNPLAADSKYWGHWILEKAQQQIGKFYPKDSDGGLPVAYLWAKTVRSPDPTVNAHIPLVRQLWLCKKSNRNVALKMTPNRHSQRCEFTIVEGEAIDFDPDEGTMRRGDATCPFTGAVASIAYLREQARSGKMNQQLMAVVSVVPGKSGKLPICDDCGRENIRASHCHTFQATQTIGRWDYSE